MKRSGVVKDDYTKKDENMSPIFVLFLDVVYQLLNQYPTLFEFNSEFLRFLSFHYYSGKYGTFLCNSMKELSKDKISSNTISIWSEVFESYKKNFLNLYYDNKYSTNIIFPNYSLYKMKIWQENYFQFSDKVLNTHKFDNYNKKFFEYDKKMSLKELKKKIQKVMI